MKRYLSLASVIMATLSSAAMAANTVDNTISGYVRDAVSTNAGVEVILPITNTNTKKTNLTMYFDVYPVASATKLFSTPSKTFALQTVPACAQSVDSWTDGNGNSNPVFVNNFEVQMVSLVRYCGNDGMGGMWQVMDTLVYAADVSQPAGATWSKNYPNVRGDALSVVNVDTTATPEILIVTSPYNSSGGGSSDVTMTFLRQASGAIAIAPITRTQGNTQ
jgi:hypothetical protein